VKPTLIPGVAPAFTATRRRLLQTTVAAVSVSAATAWPALAQRVGPVADPFVWPDITLIDGQVLPASAWRDTAAVLVFWATHCPFCTRHNAHVEKLHRAAAGMPLRVLTFSSDTDLKRVQRYRAQHDYTFAISMVDTEAMRLRLALRRTIPTTVGISRAGRVGLALPGEMFEEDLLDMQKLARTPT